MFIMKILLVTPFYKPYLGGVERVVSELSKELVKQGHEVAILTTPYSFPRKYNNWKEKEDIEGVEVNRLRPWPRTALPFFAVPLTFFSPTQVKKILDIIKPDAVIYFGDKWFLGNFLVKLLSKKEVKHLWCPVFHDLTLLKQWLRPVNWLFGKFVNSIAVVSSVEKEKVHRSYWLNRSDVKIIPWGVNCTVGALPAKPVKTDIINILSVGRLSKHKGQLWLAEVFLEAVKRTSNKCQLTLVGSIEDSEVYEKVVKLSNCGIVTVIDVNDEKLAEYYQNSDIFALFPEYESFGLVFLEAMSYGMPVLTHKVGALPEVLKEGAILVGKYNKEQAVTKMVKLIENVSSRKDLGEKGKYFVENNYSWEKCAEGLIKCLYQ